MKRIVDFVAYVFIALYTLAAALVSVHRFWQYEVFYYDFGIFDQAIWNVAHFWPPIIDHFVIPGKVIFADHFSPSMFLLTPIYWITSRPEALLIAQAIAVGLSALVLYKLGRSLAIVIAYLLFVGTQNALIADIHEATFMMLPLTLTLYAIVKKRMTLFWISFLITLGFKESAGLLGVGLAILMYLTNKQWRKTAIAVGIISIVWSVFTTQILIPYFYGRRYFYTPTLDPNPLRVLWSLVDSPVKIQTLFLSLTSFGFLPLLYPPAWPLILQDLATRFLDKDFTLRWGLSLHYSAQLSVILAFSSVMVLNTYKKYTTFLSIALIIIAIYLHQFKLHGPLGLSYNPAFYAHTKNFTFLDGLIARVPKGASVMTMNNIATHLIHTNTVYLLRAVYDDFMPDYFVFDLRPGQNFNNFFGADIDALLLTLPHDTRYRVVYQTDYQYIYKRN